MKHKLHFWVIAVLIALLLIIGVPIGINEAYKYNSGYLTLWGAPDVLSYYGTILSATIVIATLAVTIIFTRRQIQRESFLRSKTEQWR